MKWFKKKPDATALAWEAAEKAREHRDLERVVKMHVLQRSLGFVPGDDSQSWLRLHELLADFEARISKLEVLRRETGTGEIKRDPIFIEEEGRVLTCFDEEHSFMDIVRYMVSAGCELEDIQIMMGEECKK